MCVPFLSVNVYYTNNLHCHFPSNLDEYDGQSLAGSEAGSYGPARLHDYQTFLHDLPCHTIRSQSQEIGACLVVRLATLQDSQTFLHDLTCHTIRSQSQEIGACLVVRLATQQDSTVRCSLLCIIHVCTFVYICSMRQFLTVVALRVT